VCGNCLDDDANGLADLEDPACCADAASVTVKPGVRIRPKKNGDLSFKIGGFLAFPNPTALTGHVAVQLSQSETGTILCARIPASAFVSKKGRHRFKDRSGALAGAAGIGKVKLTPRKKDGSTKVRANGKAVELAAPAVSGAATVTIGVGERCAAADVSLRRKGKTLLRAP
jgi:hypothetical protein